MLRPTGEGGETTKKRRRKPEPKSEPKRRRAQPSRTSQPREREPRKRLPQERISNYQPEKPLDPRGLAAILAPLSQFEPDPMGSLTGDFSLAPRTSPNVLDLRGQDPWEQWKQVFMTWARERGEM